MLNAGIDKVHRDLILGHSFRRMDAHYLAPSEDTFKKAMAKYTLWMDEQITEAHKVLTKPLTKIKKELAQTR